MFYTYESDKWEVKMYQLLGLAYAFLVFGIIWGLVPYYVCNVFARYYFWYIMIGMFFTAFILQKKVVIKAGKWCGCFIVLVNF